ncbi:hypothetical protein KC19_10G040700 [Ceratodon purpureus]|uniref:BTB/POZ and TAZ domain-containing protein 4 n=1 Tax=Ceratodon purpureus TaxID=3225 RepID=A0A8T0GHV8_CERPU|nr:hypothetical protein KC19_10G040700 [Ceratodon purpureus]KAG0558598.1 hypothetical protein KC19_10G040700 [Ceratodon purpureus]KAG0558599.1 hypothetical protein KC19_10G040700 [Ceratodon purpureus]KAG0558600.1 hypothetical protein KC19_10G040700 [Ceratodon purpureus]KAG0558601.1 hypothetical protein KC19_10G040700 [Ceratodon purpureus]
MILTARGKEVQFWIHLGNPNLPGSDVMDSACTGFELPPLLPRSQAHDTLHRAASTSKEKSPTIFPNLSADETQIYGSVKRPREVTHSSQQSSPLSSGRIQCPKLLKSASTTSTSEVRARVPKQLRPSHYDSYPSSTSMQKRSPVKLSLRRSASAVESRPVTQASSNVGIPPAPPLPPSPLRTRISSFTPKRTSLEECHRNGLNLLHKKIIDSWDRVFFKGSNTDVTVYTDDGYELGAHSTVLMCSSPVLKCILQEQFRTTTGHAFLNIRGVPFQAVRCFVRFLYSCRCEQDDMEEFALHLLVLAHAYVVPSLKRVCTDSYENGLLNSDNVVDVLQVARLCDASRLHLLCLRRIVSDFKAVSRSDGWRIMKESDPTLEQELVEAVIEAETKRREKERKLDDDKVYAQLHDAMDALVHICQHGCRFMSPHKTASNCSFPACKGLEYLVRHFAACKMKVSGGCVHCKRMWQLFELHSRMCTSKEPCKVPLCRHFKERVGQQVSRKEEMRWTMLVRKVQAARAATGAMSLAAMSARFSQVL